MYRIMRSRWFTALLVIATVVVTNMMTAKYIRCDAALTVIQASGGSYSDEDEVFFGPRHIMFGPPTPWDAPSPLDDSTLLCILPIAAHLSHVEYVTVRSCPNVTSESVRVIIKSFDPKDLFLRHTGVDDSLIAEIAAEDSIERLDVRGTRITIQGLRGLHFMPRLRELYVDSTQVSESDLPELKAMFPNTELKVSKVRPSH